MQPKVGDKITASNGSVWFVKEGEKIVLLPEMKKVRGTNEWRIIKVGDWVVTTSKLVRQVAEVIPKENRVIYTIGTWDEFKTVDYIAPNEFDLCEGDFVVSVNNFGVVKKHEDGKLRVSADKREYYLSKHWHKVDTPVFMYKVLHNNAKDEKLAYYYRGVYYDCLTMEPLIGIVQRYVPRLLLKNRRTGKEEILVYGDSVVTKNSNAYVVESVDVENKKVTVSNTPTCAIVVSFDHLDYITDNIFDMCLFDYVNVNGVLGKVCETTKRKAMPKVWLDGVRTSVKDCKRIKEPLEPQLVLHPNGETTKAILYRGQWYRADDMLKVTARLPIDHCNKWYILHDKPTYIFEFKNVGNRIQYRGHFAGDLNNAHTFSAGDVLQAEKLLVRGSTLVSKSRTYDLKTGHQISPNQANRQLLGAWFEVPESKPFPPVAAQLQEISPHGDYVLRQPNGDLTAIVIPELFGKYEQLRVEGNYLIGKSATYSKATGSLLNQHDMFCGKWYEMRVHGNLMPMFCYDFRNGRLQFEDVYKRAFIAMEPQNFYGHEELKIEGDKLVGKANTYDLKSGQRVVMTVKADSSKMDAALEKTKSIIANLADEAFGIPLLNTVVQNSYKVFTEQALQAVVSQFSIPAKMLSPGNGIGETQYLGHPTGKLWIPGDEPQITPHFYNPQNIKPTDKMPNVDNFTIGGIPGFRFQHIYRVITNNLAARVNVGLQPVKKLTKEQLKDAKFLKLHLATIRTKKKLHWAMENEFNLYTNVFQPNRCAHGCRIEYLEIDGKVCKNYVAIWQDKNFCVLHIDQIIGKLYYFKVVT